MWQSSWDNKTVNTVFYCVIGNIAEVLGILGKSLPENKQTLICRKLVSHLHPVQCWAAETQDNLPQLPGGSLNSRSAFPLGKSSLHVSTKTLQKCHWIFSFRNAECADMYPRDFYSSWPLARFAIIAEYLPQLLIGPSDYIALFMTLDRSVNVDIRKKISKKV